ncbi:hypothetical protein KAU43_03725 [candidate division WOR-3 bacterium]|nr:hypothetical protein [candidate division WOR-3 bacterium]
MIKIKAKGQIIALLYTGELIAFDNRDEYLKWTDVKSNLKQVNSLYADGKVLYESIQRGKGLMAHMQTFDYQDLEDIGIDTTLID